MDLNTKVMFRISLGDGGPGWEEEFTLEELGYKPDIHTSLEGFLEQEYREWSAQYIDGSFTILGE